MVALIDVDSLFYKATYKLEDKIPDLNLEKEDYDTIVATLAELAEDRCEKMIEEIIYDIHQDENNIKISSVELFVTDCHNSFRKLIYPEYKANRKSNDIVTCLRQIYIFKYDAFSHDSLEADDLIAIRANELGQNEYIIVTMDKDLYQIGGFVYNYYQQPNKYDENGNIIESYSRVGLSYISELEAKKLLAVQVLMGDATDNIKGLPKYGKVKANKIIEPINSDFGLIKAVLKEYKTIYGDEYLEPLLLTYKLVKLGQ